MHIEIRHIKAFLAVASELHFGKAANRLNIAQPALSRTIQSLEALLEVRLLERSTRSVQLTAAGQVFRDNCVQFMQQMTEGVQAAQRVGRGDMGSLSIGYVDVALLGALPAIVRRFKKRHPGAKLELTPLPPEDIARLLAERRIDCGFILGPVRDARFDLRCVQSDPAVVVMPVSHRLTLKSKIALADLSRERFVMLAQEGWSAHRQEIQHLCVKAGFIPQVSQDVQNTEAMMAFVAAETGIGICPASVQSTTRSGVVARPLVDAPLSFDLHCAWHKENATPVLAEFAATVSAYADEQRGGRADPTRRGGRTGAHDAAPAAAGMRWSNPSSSR